MVRRVRMEAKHEQGSVTQLELFFDLVFVFALTQVTALMSDDLSARGVIRGMLLLGLLWWSWICYAWLGNVVRMDEGAARTATFAAMAAMFVLALAIPEAFDDLPGGLQGPVVVAACYFVFRALHIGLFWIISADDPVLRRQVIRFAPSMMIATVVLLVAAETTGAIQTVLWAAALAGDYIGTLLAGARWRLRSTAHFAERHGLILIVALGESIVAIGVGIAKLPISWPIVIAALLGLTLSAALWWAYFDVTSTMAEHALAACPEATRPRMARDAYTYLHGPMVAGIVLLALGFKKVLEYAGNPHIHTLTDPLKGIGLYALYGGVALYLLGHVAFKLRILRVLNRTRLVAAVVVVLLVPLVAQLPALASLAILSCGLLVLVVGETLQLGEDRHQIRHNHH